MSGGSYQYAYSRLADFIFDFALRANTPQRKAFLKHLEKVKKAMHDIEWVDSSDYGPGDENDAIMACVNQAAVIEASVEDARRVMEELKQLIEKENENDQSK